MGFAYPMFNITFSGTILLLRHPALGCSPRPLNIPGGSTMKLETFSTWLLKRHVLYLASCSALSALSFFLSSIGRFFFSSLCFSRCSFIFVKSKSSREVAPRDLSNSAKKLAEKFFLTSSWLAKSDPIMRAHQLQTSSTSGLTSRG